MKRDIHMNSYQNLDSFPGWENAPDFFKRLILEKGCKVVADIGGGANPLIDIEFIEKHGLQYYVVDISESELRKADPRYRKAVFDITADAQAFEHAKLRTDFDLVFSHMMMEHVQEPLKAHANFARLLRPGGLSVHMYPSKYNFPLFMNTLIPEALSLKILPLLQPNRTQDGKEGKFVAFYRYCGPPSRKLANVLNEAGFAVESHTAYVGHQYYKRLKPLALIERMLRKVILALHIPMTSANLLVLRKQSG